MGKKLAMDFLGSILLIFLYLYRKANNLFEKNAAPILHLAGVEITLLKVCIAIHTVRIFVQYCYYC